MNNLLNNGLLNKEPAFFAPDIYSEGGLYNPALNAISFELHSPVKTIQTNLQLLKKFCNYSDISILKETFSFSEDSIEYILGFVEKINFLCTPDKSSIKLKPELFSFRLLINHIYAELRQLGLDIRRLRLKFVVDNYKIYLDKCLCIHILVNLLSNALKFSNREVELFISASTNKLSIVVRDYGIGIPENQITNIFNPFVRGSNVNTITGSGLGLFIVANAIKCVNGNISVHSVIGIGTEFRITLPYCIEEADLINTSPENKLFEHFDISASEYSQIVGAISHELRTPIAILKSNIQIIKKISSGIDDESKDKSICKCEESLKKLERVLENIQLLNIAIKSGVYQHATGSGLSRLQAN